LPGDGLQKWGNCSQNRAGVGGELPSMRHSEEFSFASSVRLMLVTSLGLLPVVSHICTKPELSPLLTKSRTFSARPSSCTSHSTAHQTLRNNPPAFVRAHRSISRPNFVEIHELHRRGAHRGVASQTQTDGVHQRTLSGTCKSIFSPCKV